MGILLERIDDFLRRVPMSETALGEQALNDRTFVRTLRDGRDIRVSTQDRMLAWMDQHLAAQPALRVIRFEIPEATPTLNEWQRLHFREKAKRQMAIAWLVRGATIGVRPVPPLARCRVTVERYKYGPAPDHDNLVAGCKPLLDVLVTPYWTKGRKATAKSPARAPVQRNKSGLGFIVDDAPSCLTKLEVTAHPADQREGRTVVTITEVA